jgi:hypothetical protein
MGWHLFKRGYVPAGTAPHAPRTERYMVQAKSYRAANMTMDKLDDDRGIYPLHNDVTYYGETLPDNLAFDCYVCYEMADGTTVPMFHRGTDTIS